MFCNEKAAVLKVTDGDTMVVFVNGKVENVRLLGIDAPESKPNDKALKQTKESTMTMGTILQAGLTAKLYLKSLVKPGDVVELEFDNRKRDWYQRLLAYVYIQDGRMINELMVKNGFAKPLSYAPNIKYKERFKKVYYWADHDGRGLHRFAGQGM
ncbi:MAG: thermonuclease family protein [Candidatus Margulisbacteria bacterium]|nr:thermonuclease family protein [Candidatus Margulisiibacteriota bacterium]